MPDDRPFRDAGPSAEREPPDGRQPRRRRRRSMDTYGGISVSDVFARHTGERPAFTMDGFGSGQEPATSEPAATPENPPPVQEPARKPARMPTPPVLRPEARPPRSGPHALPAAPPPAAPRRPTAQPPTPRRPPAISTELPVPDAADQPTRRRPPVADTGRQSPRSPQQPPQYPRRPTRPAYVPPRSALDPMLMTDQMEVIDDATKYRRKIDDTLARFSAAHDEMNAEQAKRKSRRERIAAPVVQTRLQEKKQRRNHRSARASRIAVLMVAALVFLGTGAAWGAKTWFNSKFTEIAALDEDSADIQNAAGQRGDENFLIVGSDTRDGATEEEGVGNADNIPGARSDTVMIAHIPADRQRVVMVSFPRDLEVSRPECQRWDSATAQYSSEKSPAQKIVKLNTAYAVGGPQCVTRVIQQISGMKMTHFVGIDFTGFKDMVDAVQGVTVHTDIPIDDSILGTVIDRPGDIKLTGDQALNFVRARHVKGDVTSDYGRIKRQQEFLGSLLKTVMSKDVMLNAGKITGFVTAFAKATFGENLGVDQMLTLAQSMKGLDSGKISFLTVPTTGIANTRGNEVLLPAKADGIFKALIENRPLPVDQPPPVNSAPENGSVAAPTSTTSRSSTTKSASSG